MAAPSYTLAHGTGTLITEAEIIKRADGFDEGSFEAHSDSELTFTEGAAMPGYAGLYAQEVRSKLDGVDEVGNSEWMHNIRAVGLRNSLPRLIASDAQDSEEGFDTGYEEWAVPVASKTAYLTYGRAHSNHANLRCVNPKEKRSPVAAFAVISLQFKGIKSGTKPIRTKVDTISREVQRENLINKLPGGDATTAHTWNILRSQPSLQRMYLTTALPNTALVGIQGVSVPGFPAQYFAPFSAADSTVIWNWPNGTVLAALSYDQIPGASIYFVTEYWLSRARVDLA